MKQWGRIAVRRIPLFALVIALMSPLIDSCSSNGNSNGNPGEQDILAVCARMSACLPDEVFTSLTFFYALFYGLNHNEVEDRSTFAKVANMRLRCLWEARGCDATRSCVEASGEEGEVCTDAGGVYCVNDIGVECHDGFAEARKCREAGLVCGKFEGSLSCGEEFCDYETYTITCDGDLYRECEFGNEVVEVYDCSSSMNVSCSGMGEDMVCRGSAGGTCSSDETLDSPCIGDGAPCDEESFDYRCEGEILRGCRQGFETEFDCKKLGSDYTCKWHDMMGFSCIPVEEECEFGFFPETCEDGVITFCAMGRITDLDCRKYGYSGCEPTTEFKNAYCTK